LIEARFVLNDAGKCVSGIAILVVAKAAARVLKNGSGFFEKAMPFEPARSENRRGTQAGNGTGRRSADRHSYP
jgi:hypothetical protein